MKARTIYGIPNCDTVKHARAWLAEHGHEAVFHDYKKQGVPVARLQAWMAAHGWERLVNRQGTAWRKLDEATKLLNGGTPYAAASTAVVGAIQALRRQAGT